MGSLWKRNRREELIMTTGKDGRMNTGKDGQLIFVPHEYREQGEDKNLSNTCAKYQSLLYECQAYIKQLELQKELSKYKSSEYQKMKEIETYNKLHGI